MTKVEEITQRFMKLVIGEVSFDAMMETLRDDGTLSVICKHFDLTENVVINTLHEELFIPGMTNEIAWQALCWIETDIEKNTKAKTLVGVIRNCIMMSGVFFTNVSEDVRNSLQSEGTLDATIS